MNKFRIPRSLWLAGGAAVVVGLLATAPWELTRLSGATDGVAETPDAGSDQAANGQRGRDPQQRLPPPLPPSQRDWWKDADIQAYVGLTADQVRRIDEIYEERAREMEPFIIEWRHQRDEFNKMARARQASVAQFAIQVARFEALDAKLSETRAVMLYRMSLELSAAQYDKLQEYRDRRGRTNSRGSGPDR
jgi:hypothetical protein